MTGTILGYISARDHRVMRRLNGWYAPRWLQVWMTAATRGGDGWLWYALAILVALFGGDDRWRALESALIASSLGIALFLVLKRMFKRSRPCAVEPHCWANLLPPDQFSFPSGHTITAFAMTLSIGAFYPVLLPVLLFCAGSIALSRVILGMHFLSDVLAGAAIGSVLAYTSLLIGA